MYDTNTPVGKALDTAKRWLTVLGKNVCDFWDKLDVPAKARGLSGAAAGWFRSLPDKFRRLTDRLREKESDAPEEKPQRSVLASVWNVFTWLIVVAFVAAAVLFVGVRLVGLTPYCVLSGSMEPIYQTGSLIYVKKAAPEDIEIGDAITFVMNEDLVVATHQVYDIDYENRQFFTQGVNNRDEFGVIQHDAQPVLFDNLVGKPVFTIPKLGYAANYLSSPPGMYVGIAGALILLILFFLPDLLQNAEESDNADKEKKGGKSEKKKDGSERILSVRTWAPTAGRHILYNENESDEDDEPEEENEESDDDDDSLWD